MKNILVFALTMFVSVVVFAQEQTVTKTFSDIKSIRLTTASGDIELKKGPGSEVKVVVKYPYDKDEFEPIFEVNGSKLRVEERFSGRNHNGSSRWYLEIPDNLRLDVNTGSGNLNVDNLNIEISSNTGSGDITLNAVKGELDFNTGSGNIELEQVDGEIKMNTGSGNIRARSSSGYFSFNAGSGDIKLDQLKGDFRVNTGSGNVSAKSVSLTGSSSFNTGSGDATVSLTSELNYNISVNSGSGNSKLNFNGAPISGTVVMSANKRGGEIIAPFKFDKEETIEENHSNARIEKTTKLGSKEIQIRVGTGSGTAEITK